jgi:hypothetical protein
MLLKAIAIIKFLLIVLNGLILITFSITFNYLLSLKIDPALFHYHTNLDVQVENMKKQVVLMQRLTEIL